MKPTVEMNEREISREVARVTMKIAKILDRVDHDMMGAVLANMMAMWLWTFPADKRDEVTAYLVRCAHELIATGLGPEEAPPEFRAPS